MNNEQNLTMMAKIASVFSHILEFLLVVQPQKVKDFFNCLALQSQGLCAWSTNDYLVAIVNNRMYYNFFEQIGGEWGYG